MREYRDNKDANCSKLDTFMQAVFDIPDTTDGKVSKRGLRVLVVRLVFSRSWDKRI